LSVFLLASLSPSLSFLGQSAFRECPKAKEHDSHALVTNVQSSNQSRLNLDVTHIQQQQQILHVQSIVSYFCLIRIRQQRKGAL